MKARLVIYAGVFCLGLFFLNLIAGDYIELQSKASRLEKDMYVPFIRLSLISFLFGILIEWKRLSMAVRGNWGLSWLLLPALMLLVLGVIPPWLYYETFGIGSPYGIKFLGWLIEPLRHSITNNVISILAGVLLVRSVTKENEKLDER